MTYNGSSWKLSDDFPGMTREDSYKAVYAPNYEVKADGSLGLKEGTNSLTTEYLTCEGTKPITIAFGKRDYSRIRIYTGGKDVNLIAPTSFTPADKTKVPDNTTYTISPDGNGNVSLYCSWSENTPFELEEPFGGGSTLYIGTPAMGMIKAASEPNKSYLIDCTWVTLNLNEASSAVTDWSKYTDSGYTQIRFIGVWNDSYRHSFAADTNTGNSKITSIDLSGVTGLENLYLTDLICSNCSSLSEVKLPKDLKHIPTYGFSGCINLKKIDIPSSVISIWAGAFYNCSSLTSIVLPQNIEKIKDNVFRNCANLSKVVCYATTPPTFETSAFDNTPSEKVLYVPADYVSAYENSSWKNYFSNIKKISEMPEDE
jgi:hypothetical protein